jgi:hypothetical protein
LNNTLFKIISYCPKHRRGIAGVVTSGILLAAVSIMGVMLLTRSQTSILQQKQELTDVFDTRMNKINEDMFYENIWFATPSGLMSENHLNVTVANIGILGLNVTTIQVTNSTGTNSTSIPYPEPCCYTDGGIETGSSKSFNVTYAWQSTDKLDVLIFTDRGNQFITQVVAP